MFRTFQQQLFKVLNERVKTYRMYIMLWNSTVYTVLTLAMTRNVWLEICFILLQYLKTTIDPPGIGFKLNETFIL